MPFEIAHFSLSKPNKLQNGDFHSYEFIKEENILIGILADGVGSNACDWKASKVSCQNFILFFKRNNTFSKLIQRIEQTIKEVNQEILLEDGQCEGMKSTLSLIVWEFNQQQIHTVNIGDSRIYTYQNNTLTQSSKDETKSVILKKRDGKPMVIAGVVVTAEGVTNVMGSPELRFEVQTFSDKNITGIVLACDGFYGCKPSFEKDIVNTFNSLNLQASLNQIKSAYVDYQKDDMTTLLIRRKKPADSNNEIANLIFQNKKVDTWSDLEIKEAILLALESNIQSKNQIKVNALLDFIKKNHLDLGREHLSTLISLMAKKDFQDRTIYQKILNHLRQSKF